MIYDVGMRYGCKLLRKHYHGKLQVGLRWLRISNDTDVKHVFFISSHNTISGDSRLYHSQHPNNLPFHPVPFVLHPFGPSPRQQGVVVRCWDPRPAKPQRQRQVVVVIINNKLGRDMSKEKPPKKEYMFFMVFHVQILGRVPPFWNSTRSFPRRSILSCRNQCCHEIHWGLEL